MRRRAWLLTFFIIVLIVCSITAVLGYWLTREPEFYRTARGIDPDPFLASRTLTRFSDLQNDIRSKPEWEEAFSAEELNAFMIENLDDEEWGDVLPPGAEMPRIAIEGDRLFLGLRNTLFGQEWLHVVTWVELKIWLVHEPNTIAVEVVQVKIGDVPYHSQRWLDQVFADADDYNINVTWYRTNGNPVGLFRFYANQTRPPIILETAKLAEGQIMLKGRAADQRFAGMTPR